MKCGYCGHEFGPEEAGTACGSCPLVKGCHLVRCPRCGYEMPPEAKLITLLRNLKNSTITRTGKTVKEKSK
jgi:hypothetical protein